MKRKIFFCVSALLLTLALIACGSSGGDDDNEAPNVGSAADLPAAGATAPADSDEALAVFSGVMEGFSNGLNASSGGSLRKARGSEPISETISWVSDTTNVNGTIKGSVTMPDAEPTTAGTYNDLIKFVLALEINGTITNAEFTDDAGETYTVSGKFKETLDFGFSFDVVIPASGDPTADYDYSYDVAFGTAFSVKRLSDNVGGKFVISFADGISKQNVKMNVTNPEEDFAEPDVSFLDTATAKLKVYDDSDNLVLDTTIPFSDIEGLDPTSMMGE